MKFRRELVFVLTGLMCVGACSTSGATGQKSVPNEAQVEEMVQAAVTSHTKLPSFTPSLTSLSTSAGVYTAQGSSLSFECDPANSEHLAKSPKPCWQGDTRSKDVVVLLGDSNAGNWEPALSLALLQLKMKLAVFVYPGCSSQFVKQSPAPIANGENWRWCNLFHASVVGAIEKLHPKAIISAELGEGFSGKAASFLPYADNWKTTFDLLTAKSPGTIRILMGTTPVNVAGPVPVCLSRYVSSSTNAGMAACSPIYYPGTNFSTNPWSYWQRDLVSARVSGAKLIQTYKWFCGFQSTVKDYCPAVIGNNLVYVDTDHISIAYMETLQNVVKTELVAAGL
jgi:hypothetical protein